MEVTVVVILFFLLWICNGYVFGSSTQSSIEAAKKETGIICIQSDINGLKDDMHELLKRVIKNENEIEFLKSENQYLTNELTNKRRQFSCEINELHENIYENQKAVQYTNTEINHLNETIKEMRNGVDRLEELERRRSEESITECIEKSETIGKTFYLGFLESYGKYGDLYLYIVSSSDGSCQVCIPSTGINTTFSVLSTRVKSFKISPDVCLDHHGIQRKAVFVKCDIPVSVYGLTYLSDEVDGFLALPYEVFGQDYMVTSFTLKTPRNTPHSNSNFGIIAISKSTNITITFRMSGGIINYKATRYGNDDILNITLVRFETFYLSHDYDLSGTLITASSPVAVMSGVRTSYLRNGYGNHMEEMIIPNEHLGRDFIVPKLYDSQCNFRIFALEQTRVRTYNNSSVVYINIQSRRFKEYENYDLYTLQSSVPVQVQLYCNGASTKYDAFMATLPSIQHFKSSYKFPVVNDFKYTDRPQHFYLTIIIQSYAKAGLRLDSKEISNYKGTSTVTLESTLYSVITVELSVGLHEIQQNNDIPFGLIVFGRNKYSGYGFPAGFSVNIKP
ncbi:IgGFc-binding protein-like isoform X1 [Mytilus edulis]|uniref:IgGFc-binding protein-like isoform X1 n=1 Tax=Mytilus edulis TaxID=6550 RepID=UPI0039F1098C